MSSEYAAETIESDAADRDPFVGVKIDADVQFFEPSEHSPDLAFVVQPRRRDDNGRDLVLHISTDLDEGVFKSAVDALYRVIFSGDEVVSE